MLLWVRLLTVCTFRLNSRDRIRDRSNIGTDSPVAAFNVSSIRIEPLNEFYRSEPSQRGVSVTLHRPNTSNFEGRKSEHDVETTFGILKLV